MRRPSLLIAFLSHAAMAAANTVVINARVITVDKTHPSAEAFAFENGRITAVGTNDEIQKLRTPSTVVIDLKGRTVTPGFNDAHLHPQAIFEEDSPYYRVWLGGDRVKTIDDLISALQRKAAITPAGKLINGYGYNDVLLGRHPNRHDLDKVSTTQPVVITHGSGHITVVNSLALSEAGITKDAVDPPGGALDREPDGTPNGVIRESARQLLRQGRGVEERMAIPHDQELQGYLNCFRQYSARGITSVGVAGGSPASFRLMQEVRDLGNPVRVGFMFSAGNFDELQAAGIGKGLGDDRLRITALKSFQGNSLSGRTCWLSQAYSDRPGYYGIPPARTQEQLEADYEKWWNAAWQVATHSNGDREIDMVLTAIERLQTKNPRSDARWRIEHASVMDRGLLDRAKRDGVILVFHSYMWEYGPILASYGAERLSMMHAYRTAIDMGIPVAAHSDSPVSAAYPLRRIQDMVTRKDSSGVARGESQRIGVGEAIKAWTLDGANATFEEGIKGSITPGKVADFVVLDEDPRNVPPDKIQDIRIEATYLAGERVYEASATRADLVPQPPLGYLGGRYGDGDEEEDSTGGIP